MRFRKLLLIFCASLFVAGVLSVCLAPFVVAAGLRLWIARTAQQEGLQIAFGKIEAPLLRPVVVHNLQIASGPEAPLRVRIESPRVELALNLSALFSHSRGHVLRALTATEGMMVDIRGNPQSTSPHSAWQALDDLLADNFVVSGLKLHVENGDTTIDLRGGTLSGAQIEAGVFSADEITIASPWFCKSFFHLRGATSWQENRFSIGALTLARGLDLDAIRVDLSQIGESRIGLELNMDAFGGKIRASVSSDDHANKRTWDVAGSVSEVSLAQMSEALEFTDRAGGSLHACKFTFRGDTTNLPQATATVWAEVTGLTWRDRTADTIIIGASLYNRQVQIEQVFVKQLNNQLTLTGESALPEKLADWLNPDFRGDISASINDLGDFARLFGASPSDFAGKVDISGNVDARERKLAGQLTMSGKSLVVFRVPVESLEVKLGLKESQVEIANFDLRRKNDFFRGQASVDLSRGRSYSGTFTSSIADAADYVALMPEALRAFPFGGSLNVDWSAKGAEATHSGTFHVRGRGLHPLGSFALPFDAEFEGDYSPDDIFFRQFNLSNPHASFSAFVSVAKDYLQLQTLHLDLNGKPKLQGNIFLPVSLSKLQMQGDWLAALSENPNFDLDVTLDPTDLAELARAVSAQPKMSGQASGNLEVHGLPASLDGKSTLHLRNLAFGNEPYLSADLELQTSLGILHGKGNAVASGSDTVDFEWSIPYQFEKEEAGYALKKNAPFSAALSFPLVLASKLPRYVCRGIFADGILSGHLELSQMMPHPHLVGDLQLVNGRFLGGLTLSTRMTFRGQTAAIDFARLTRNHIQYGARGELDFRELSDVTARIFPTTPLVVLTPLGPGDCIDGIELSPGGIAGSRRESIGELHARGSLFSPDWTITLIEKHSDDPLETLLRGGSSRTFSICHDQEPSGTTLTLGLARPPLP